MDQNILSVKNLSIHLGDAPLVQAVTFHLAARETLAIVGESGSGKTLTALSLLKLLPHNIQLSADAFIFLDGENLRLMPEHAMRAVRGRKIAMIFQEPMVALNPVLNIQQQLEEVLVLHTKLDSHERQRRMETLLHAVGLEDGVELLTKYPHHLSGGMRQRVMIAMALATEPDVLIADEPTTALDVTIQAQILALLKELQHKFGMSMLFITHDLGVVRQVADTVAVMFKGQLVEYASADAFFKGPHHPYTQALFHALPSLEKRGQTLAVVKERAWQGDEPKCVYAKRCPYAIARCTTTMPIWQGKGNRMRCHREAELRHLINESMIIKPVTPPPVSDEILLTFFNLEKTFVSNKAPWRAGHKVHALKGVSGWIRPGETLAVVGESGSGKTTLAKILVGLLQADAGELNYRTLVASDIQMIFQDPHSSMNPKWRVEDILAEGLMARGLYPNHRERRVYLAKLLEKVGLNESDLDSYPHAFSGGQKQRIAIARALSVGPKLIVCDEPTSALDVSVQAQILNLLKRLQLQLGIAYIFVSHNMGVVSYFADRVMVMYQGEVVEEAEVESVMQQPKHPYTRALLASVPEVDSFNDRHRLSLSKQTLKDGDYDYSYAQNETS